MKELLGDGIGQGPIKLTGINLEISSKCNLNCRHCFRRTYIGAGKDELMDIEILNNIMPELKHLHSIDLTGWGEPLLHPEFGEILKDIRRNFPGALSFTTNGILMDETIINYILEAEVDTVCFSTDAYDDESYREVRGRHWKKVENAVLELASRKKIRGRGLPRIYASFLLKKERLRDLYRFGDKMTQLMINGVILQQLTGVFGPADLEEIAYSGYYGGKFDDDELAKDIKDLKEELNYLQVIGPETIFTRKQQGCGAFPIGHLFIKAGGDVSPCCTLGYPVLLLNRKSELRRADMLVLGNIKRQSLAEIWDSDKAVAFRAEMVAKGSAEACADCIGLYMRR
jgi:MoaA/NifB/PqqE/SkfB family radical SAM enzyme